jgi:AraC-like DNA-binding protein
MSISSIAGARVLQSIHRENYLGYLKSDRNDPRIINTMLFIISGEALFDIGKKRIHVKKNDIICHKQNTILERCPIPGKAASYMLLHCDIIGQNNSMLTFSDIDIPFLTNVKHPGNVLRVMKRIHKVFYSQNILAMPLCSELALKLITLIYSDRKNTGKSETILTTAMHARIRDSLDYINTNYKSRLSVPELAKRAFMHPSYFSHLFAKEVGLAPHKYITEMKISKAKDFMMTYDYPLSFTGEELGFHDHSHFYKTFKQTTGETPGEYIRRMKIVYDPKVS